MNNSRDFILEKAFAQYLELGYDGVSISVIQESTNLGRATIYYHFVNKESLFGEVIREYVAKVMLLSSAMSEEADIDIERLIQLHIEQFEMIVSLVLRVNPKLRLTSYLALLLHAYTHDEGFRKFADEMREKRRSAWRLALRNGIRKGIVREEIDPEQTADLFCGLDEFDEWEKCVAEIDPSHCSFARNCRQLFHLIKKQE